MAIIITNYGHACFKVDDGKNSILFDPYAKGSVPGIDIPKGIHASNISCSHSHADHNAKELITEDKPNIDVFPCEKITVPHDDANGALRGMNDITIVTIDNKRVVHFGDIGRLPTGDEYKKIGKADIIMIPCGGYFTIDATQAKKIIDFIKPDVAILMHYRKENIGYDVLADIEEIKTIFVDLKELPSNTYTYDHIEGGITITLAI